MEVARFRLWAPALTCCVNIFPQPHPLPYLSILIILSVSKNTIVTFQISARGRSLRGKAVLKYDFDCD